MGLFATHAQNVIDGLTVMQKGFGLARTAPHRLTDLCAMTATHAKRITPLFCGLSANNAVVRRFDN